MLFTRTSSKLLSASLPAITAAVSMELRAAQTDLSSASISPPVATNYGVTLTSNSIITHLDQNDYDGKKFANFLTIVRTTYLELPKELRVGALSPDFFHATMSSWVGDYSRISKIPAGLARDREMDSLYDSMTRKRDAIETIDSVSAEITRERFFWVNLPGAPKREVLAALKSVDFALKIGDAQAAFVGFQEFKEATGNIVKSLFGTLVSVLGAGISLIPTLWFLNPGKLKADATRAVARSHGLEPDRRIFLDEKLAGSKGTFQTIRNVIQISSHILGISNVPSTEIRALYAKSIVCGQILSLGATLTITGAAYATHALPPALITFALAYASQFLCSQLWERYVERSGASVAKQLDAWRERSQRKV